MNLAEVLVERARATPEAQAFAGVSYAAWARRCAALAAALRARGIGPGDRVALLSPNTPFFIDAYFAVAAIGAVFCPWNVHLAPRELAAILDDVEPSLVLVHAGLDRADERAAELAARAQCACEVVDGEQLELGTDARHETAISDSGAAPALHPTAAARDVMARTDADAGHALRALPVERDTPAQVYSTSGSTGIAKGVVLTHGNVVAHARAALEVFGLSTREVWGHFAPLFHLADAWAVFAITLAGGRHALVPDAGAGFDADAVLTSIDREGVTMTNLVPTMWARLVDTEARTGASTPGKSLRLALSGGAAMSRGLLRRIRERWPHAEYAQTYGMTETSPFLTTSLLGRDFDELDEAQREALLAKTGRPFGPVELRVVDTQGRAVPNDARSIGEIQVRGPTVTPGYWRRPEADAAAFVDGWLKSGDLATVDARGFVDIVDRAKDMIVSGGENVYSIEVEQVFAEHDALRESAVFGVPDEHWGERVCAAVVRRRDASSVDADELTEFCRARLAGFKVPKRIDFVDELPRLGSGKIDKTSLRRAFEEAE